MQRFGFIILFILLMVGRVTLQEEEAPDETPQLRFGEPVEGRLDELTPRTVYELDGRRGEFIGIQVEVTEGNLDPVVMVVSTTGEVLVSQDDGLGRGVRLDAIRIPRNDVYRIVVARFGYTLGITRGSFELTVERVGVSSESGSSLRYNDTIINTITDQNPQLFYSFQARRGDILNIRMQRISGNLDPYLQIVNRDSTVIAASDDILGSSTLDAGVEGLIIEEDGTYVIVATRYGGGSGNSAGSFVLSIGEDDQSGLGNTVQTAADLEVGVPVEGEITANRFERYYTFRANENDLVRVSMERLSGSLDAYVMILSDGLIQLTANDDGGGGQNARIAEYRIPADGLYYVRATRFDIENGTTVGRYRLQLDVLGGAFDDVPEEAQPILYGSTVTGVIDDETPSVLYAFYGTQGDVITVSMNRGDGNLDPVVNIRGLERQLLVSDDDSGGGQNARIDRYVLSRTGVYYVEVTRYSGTEGNASTRGSYILVLAQRFD